MTDAGRVHLTADERTLTIYVPLTLKRCGGRKQVLAPERAPAWAPSPARVDNTLVKALGRAFRWRKLLEEGTHATVQEIAEAERINASQSVFEKVQ